MLARIVILVSLSLSLLSYKAAAIQPTREIVYKQASDTDLKLHVFNPPGHKSSDKRPAIVFFFGGGWSGGSPSQFYEQAQTLADLGMVAISADYRVKSRQGTSPFESVADGKSAIRWVRQHASELGIDPNKVIASGGSAGGHVAACTGVIEGYEEAGEDLSISSVPNAMVLYNPVIDTTEDGYGVKSVGPDRKFEVSPAHHVRPGIVPTIIFHGTADTTVPFENAQRFNRLMNEAGNDSTLIPFEGKVHGFFNGKFFRPKTTDTSPYEACMAKTIEFFEKLQLLPVSKETNSLHLASLFTNHMVLQRNRPIPVWGEANPGSELTVTFGQQRKSIVTDKTGHWRLDLAPLAASSAPQSMTVSCSQPAKSITISNILVGDVWICSGQSNMQMAATAVPEIEALTQLPAQIRSFKVENTVAFDEQDFCEGEWKEEYPNSAVAAAFAHYLKKSTEVPVGIILTAWGSSSLEAWMPRDMTQTVPHFKAMMDEFDADIEAQTKIKAILDGSKPWSRQDDIFLRRQSNILYNAMMAPLAPYACQGIVWYQGERNTFSMNGQIKEPWYAQNSGMLKYGDVLKKWIQRYRQEWDQPDFQLLVVMLPGYGKILDPKPDDTPESPNAHSWAWMRESQLKILDLPHTAVANTIDLGDVKNIHPKDKLPIGERLALLATASPNDSYGPVLKKVTKKKKSLVVHFNYAAGLTTIDGNAPNGFWISDESGKWIPAQASIKGETVILSAQGMKKPLYVRYAFAGKPKVNLVNGAKLPAYPFRTDRFDP